MNEERLRGPPLVRIGSQNQKNFDLFYIELKLTRNW